MISIGSVLNGPEIPGSSMDSAIRAATMAAIKLREDFQLVSNPAIHVVIHSPGNLGCLDWDEN